MNGFSLTSDVSPQTRDFAEALVALLLRDGINHGVDVDATAVTARMTLDRASGRRTIESLLSELRRDGMTCSVRRQTVDEIDVYSSEAVFTSVLSPTRSERVQDYRKGRICLVFLLILFALLFLCLW